MADTTLIPPAASERVWLLRFNDEHGDSVLESSLIYGETLDEVRARQRAGYWPGGKPGAWAVNNPDCWVWADEHYPTSRLEKVTRTIGRAGYPNGILGGWGTEEQVRDVARDVLAVLGLQDDEWTDFPVGEDD